MNASAAMSDDQDQPSECPILKRAKASRARRQHLRTTIRQDLAPATPTVPDQRKRNPLFRSTHADDPHGLLRLQQELRRFIAGMIKQYKDMDRAFEVEDLEQEAFLALHQARQEWNPVRGMERKCDFRNFFYFILQKRFQSHFPGHDKFIHIYERGTDRFVLTLTYPLWCKHKRRFPDTRFYTQQEARIVPLPEQYSVAGRVGGDTEEQED